VELRGEESGAAVAVARDWCAVKAAWRNVKRPWGIQVKGNAISFVINQGIGEDMYPDIDEKMKPLAHACCETLSRYRHLSVNPTIMDGNLLDTGEFGVMLSKGLGKYFPEDEKQSLFQDAKKLAELLIAVMDSKNKEEKEGSTHNQNQPHTPIEQILRKYKKGLRS